jgi:gas vesicle protein
METDNKQNGSTGLLLAALAGTAAGLAAGLLLAPEKGCDTRNKIMAALRKKRDARTEPFQSEEQDDKTDPEFDRPV